jgi:hypothetical protein
MRLPTDGTDSSDGFFLKQTDFDDPLLAAVSAFELERGGSFGYPFEHVRRGFRRVGRRREHALELRRGGLLLAIPSP